MPRSRDLDTCPSVLCLRCRIFDVWHVGYIVSHVFLRCIIRERAINRLDNARCALSRLVNALSQACVMAVILRYFTEFGKHAIQHISTPICGGIYARVYCIFRPARVHSSNMRDVLWETFLLDIFIFPTLRELSKIRI